MAEIIPTTGKKVAELLVKEAKFLHRATKEIESVKTKLEDIGSRLKNADVMTDGDKTWDEWASQLRDVAFQTEDVIEVSVNNVTLFDGYNVLQLIRGCCRQITTLHILKNEMDDINSKLKELDELSKTSLTTRTRSREDGENSAHHDHREEDLAASSGSDDDEDDLVGFLKEADELASLLKKEEPLGQLAVFPIWAEGGAGKTALARTIYKEEEVKSQFDCIAWVSVSQNYLVNSIWQSILKQVKELTEEEEKELQTMEVVELRHMVYAYLNKKNYLIVLDNLWAQKDWELIAKAFPNSPQKKCRVLVTTRMGEVARVANSVTDDPLQLRVLDKEESLELLLKKVFPSSLYKKSKDSLTKEMKIVAGKMLEKCEGLPIAIVLLGGILHKRRKDIFEWTDILERVQSDLTKSGDRLAKLVALSYNVLPSHLKSCFLYFGLFPKNSAIECDKLIRLWVAEGFLGTKDDKAMEDEGRTCLKELIQRCMIQVVECKSNGDPQTCRINDLVRALAVQEARKAKFYSICEEDYLEPKKDCRRMALHHKIIDFHGTSTAPDLLSSLQQSILKPPVVEGNYHLRLVGFQKEEDKLASLLTEETPIGRLSIVSVMGMEGGGKTALAQKVFNRNDVKSHFACRAWLYVSQNYGVRDLLKTMVQQLTKLPVEKLTCMEEEELQGMILNSLEEHSYLLLVLDDLWRREDWDVIERILPKPMPGQKCSVLLTTRCKEVAQLAIDPSSSDRLLKLRFLSGEDSLKLFLKTVYQRSRDDITSVSDEMLDMASKIVEECQRHPLAVVLIGGLLSVRRKYVSVWADILESLNRHEFSVLDQVLNLCYHDLSDNLRSCFLDFSDFPVNTEIKCCDLIQSWVSGGFLLSRDDKSVDKVASDCLEELIQRNLIDVAKWGLDGAPQTCRILDLLGQFARSRNMELIASSSSGSLSDIERLPFPVPLLLKGRAPHARRPVFSLFPSIPWASCWRQAVVQPIRSWFVRQEKETVSQSKTFSLILLLSFLDPFKFPNRIHSLLCFSKKPQFWFKQFPLLRVLDLEGAEDIVELPNEIRNLTLLRYLSLRGTGVKVIPPWISNLRNLQTLDAPESQIPIDTLKLKQLRHLFADTFFVVTNKSFPDSSSSLPPLRIGVLKHLHTLELNAGDWVIRGLHHLTNLRVLRLRLNGGGDENDFRAIANLKRLKVLSLTQAQSSFPMDLPSLSSHLHLNEMVVEGAITKPNDFPPLLSYLWIEHSLENGMRPIFTLQGLGCLKKLCLRLFKGGYSGHGRLTFSAGSFLKLEHLCIGVDFELDNWTVEQGAMPRLRVLHIEGGDELGKLPDGLKHITTLKELIITRGYDVKASLISGGEEWEKVKSLRPSIRYLDDSFMRP